MQVIRLGFQQNPPEIPLLVQPLGRHVEMPKWDQVMLADERGNLGALSMAVLVGCVCGVRHARHMALGTGASRVSAATRRNWGNRFRFPDVGEGTTEAEFTAAVLRANWDLLVQLPALQGWSDSLRDFKDQLVIFVESHSQNTETELMVSAAAIKAEHRIYVAPPSHLPRASVYVSMLREMGVYGRNELVSLVPSAVAFPNATAADVTTIEPAHLPDHRYPLPIHLVGRLLTAALLAGPDEPFFRQLCGILLPYARRLDLARLRSKKPLTYSALESVFRDIQETLAK